MKYELSLDFDRLCQRGKKGDSYKTKDSQLLIAGADLELRMANEEFEIGAVPYRHVSICSQRPLNRVGFR